MTLANEARNAAVNAICTLLNAGDVQFQTSADSAVATCDFANPAFGSAASGTATANAISDDTSAAGGLVDHAVLRKSDNTEIVECTCSTSGGGGDFILTNLTIGVGDTVSVTSLTITQPAS